MWLLVIRMSHSSPETVQTFFTHSIHYYMYLRKCLEYFGCHVYINEAKTLKN